MKVLTILGSPRKQGNTATLLAAVEDELASGGHEVDRVDVASLDIKGCTGCFACQEVADAPGCVQKDDAESVFERMLASDSTVYAAPLYAWGFPSQMKALIDRSVCLVKGPEGPPMTSLLEGKRAALLVTCAGPIEDNADLIQTAFERICEYAKCQVAGKCVVPSCTTPDAMSAEAVDAAKGLAAEIVA